MNNFWKYQIGDILNVEDVAKFLVVEIRNDGYLGGPKYHIWNFKTYSSYWRDKSLVERNATLFVSLSDLG